MQWIARCWLREWQLVVGEILKDRRTLGPTLLYTCSERLVDKEKCCIWEHVCHNASKFRGAKGRKLAKVTPTTEVMSHKAGR